MDGPTLLLTLTAALLLATSVLSNPLQRSLLTEPLIATVLGLLVGPRVLGWIHPDQWMESPKLVHEVTKYLLLVGLMAAALRLPHKYPKYAARSLLVLVGGGMLLMALATALIVHLVLALPLPVCLVLGGILAPTDPILATTIVTGTEAEAHVPDATRNLLTAESGMNDGLAHPLVMIPLIWLTGTEPEPFASSVLQTLLYENLLGVALGVCLGWAARHLLSYGFDHHAMSSKAFLAYALALALFTNGLLELLHMNGLLGVFVSGLTFNYGIGDREEVTSERVQELVERLFVVPGFLLFGAILPWSSVGDLGWSGVAAAALVLVARRAPVYWLVRRSVRELGEPSDALFVTWFGPMGVAALYYASEAQGRLGRPEVWSFSCLVVLGSVIAHGLSCAPLLRWYGRKSGWTGRSKGGSEAESGGAEEEVPL